MTLAEIQKFILQNSRGDERPKRIFLPRFSYLEALQEVTQVPRKTDDSTYHIPISADDEHENFIFQGVIVCMEPHGRENDKLG